MGERRLMAPVFVSKPASAVELMQELESERLAFEQQKAEWQKKIAEVDQEWDVMREVQAQTQAKLRDKLKLLAQNIEALESSKQTAVTDQPLDEDVELAEERRSILRDLNDLNESSDKLRNTIGILNDQIATLEFLARAIPCDNKEILEIVNRQLKLRIDKEAYIFRVKNVQTASKLKSLEDEIEILETISHGLQSENHSLKRKIANGKAFEKQLVASYNTLTQNSAELEGVQQSELDKVTEQMHQSLKQELKQLKYNYERQVSKLDPSPRALLEEIHNKESITELLNNKLNELIAELDTAKETGRKQIAKLQKAQSEQLSDMILRAEIRRRQSSDSTELTTMFNSP